MHDHQPKSVRVHGLTPPFEEFRVELTLPVSTAD